MSETVYVGEHLWVGNVGHFAIILSFVAALFSATSYYFSGRNRDAIDISGSWNRMGRIGFSIHAVSLLTLIGILFYAMYHNYIEYSYVFNHVSEDLPLKYILSAFWEGQEGSFMLWMFWHVVLSIVIIRTTGKFEAPVMLIMMLVQAFLLFMILGIHIPWGDETLKIGSNPTTLLRQVNDAPIFANAEYLSLIKGRGLNPLLQNYWMTIHPPTLFLGFASTTVPFAFAFAGLWYNDHKEWVRQSLHWSLFSACILGTGILLGSLWAYVALSFGGYWAWDPVENASFVPWMTLVAAFHLHIVSKNTGYGTRTMYFLYILTFFLVLYSTFMTRSGVLGDTSAHAFTEMGLEWQLILFMAFFALLGFGLYIYRYKSIPAPVKEEAVPSREFWMFIGALILLFGGILIITSTSLPVYNKIRTYFNPFYEGKVISDVMEHYNKYQLWIGVLVALLSSASLFLKFGAKAWEVQKKKYGYKILAGIAASLVLTWISSLVLDYPSWQYWVLSFSGIFAIVMSIAYMIKIPQKSFKLSKAGLSHLGFGLMLIGILASGLNQRHISSNPFVFKNIFNDEDVKKYVQLIKHRPLYSQGYLITYESDTLIDRERRFAINFQKLNEKMEVQESFTLYPHAVYSNDYTKVAAFNPDTKHYFNKDIFTCVLSLPPAMTSVEEAKMIEDSLKYVDYPIAINDTIQIDEYIIKPEMLTFDPQHQDYNERKHDGGLGVRIAVYDTKEDTTYYATIAQGLEGALVYNYPATISDAGMKIKLADTTIERYFTPDDHADYHEYSIKKDETININGYHIQISELDTQPEIDGYKAEDGDIAIAAVLHITGNGIDEIAKPLYVIRNNQQMGIKSLSSASGLHIRLTNINPETEQFTFSIAAEDRKSKEVILSIATKVPRNDYLILQATIFPGINLFWLGCILMMFGMLLASIKKYKQSRQ